MGTVSPGQGALIASFDTYLIARPRSGVAGLGRLLAHVEHCSTESRVQMLVNDPWVMLDSLSINQLTSVSVHGGNQGDRVSVVPIQRAPAWLPVADLIDAQDWPRRALWLATFVILQHERHALDRTIRRMGMRRFPTTALLVVLVLAIGVAPAFARSGHFTGKPKCMDMGTFIECTGKVAGMGGTTFQIVLTARPSLNAQVRAGKWPPVSRLTSRRRGTREHGDAEERTVQVHGDVGRNPASARVLSQSDVDGSSH